LPALGGFLPRGDAAATRRTVEHAAGPAADRSGYDPDLAKNAEERRLMQKLGYG